MKKITIILSILFVIMFLMKESMKPSDSIYKSKIIETNHTKKKQLLEKDSSIKEESKKVENKPTIVENNNCKTLDKDLRLKFCVNYKE